MPWLWAVCGLENPVSASKASMSCNQPHIMREALHTACTKRPAVNCVAIDYGIRHRLGHLKSPTYSTAFVIES